MLKELTQRLRTANLEGSWIRVWFLCSVALLVKKRAVSWAVITHAFSPNTQEAEASRSL